MKTLLSTSSKEGIERGACILPEPVGVSPGVRATSLIRRILEPYNWRLTIWKESCATNGESELPPVLTLLLTMKRMVAIDTDQELPLVSLSCMLKISTLSAEIGVHSPKAREAMRWAKCSTISQGHLSHIELRKGRFPGGSPNPHSPCSIVGQTLWSTWATSTKGWLCTPRMRPWCAKSSPLVWGLWQWGGLMA